MELELPEDSSDDEYNPAEDEVSSVSCNDPVIQQ